MISLKGNGYFKHPDGSVLEVYYNISFTLSSAKKILDFKGVINPKNVNADISNFVGMALDLHLEKGRCITSIVYHGLSYHNGEIIGFDEI